MTGLVARMSAAFGPRLLAFELALPAIGSGLYFVPRVLDSVTVSLANVVLASQLTSADPATRT